ncbi:MAG: MFS transporter [Gemmatimonadota bacterium]
MYQRLALSLTMFLALVPVTLLVPGLHELVVVAHGGTEGQAHAFMSINMIAGTLGVPLAMRWLRQHDDLRRLLVIALVADAFAFMGMWTADSLNTLFAFRLLDGLVHLPAVTLLMVAANRLSGARRGGSLGALASAIMAGVAIGSPLGGRLVERNPASVYIVGAVLLLLAALIAGSVGRVPSRPPDRSRYRWNRRVPATWVPLGWAFLDRFSIGIFVSTFTLYLANVAGVSPSERGMLIALFMIPFALLCIPAGRLAEAKGWFVPLLTGNTLFGLVFASYGYVPVAMLPVVMIVSGVLSALMFAPSLLLVSDLAGRGHGEGLFGAFQVAGSIGFLAGPIVGGILVSLTGAAGATPAYREILLGVGAVEVLLAGVSFVLLRPLAAQLKIERREVVGEGVTA